MENDRWRYSAFEGGLNIPLCHSTNLSKGRKSSALFLAELIHWGGGRAEKSRRNSQETHYIHVEQISERGEGLGWRGRTSSICITTDYPSVRRPLNVEIKRAIAQLNKQWAARRLFVRPIGDPASRPPVARSPISNCLPEPSPEPDQTSPSAAL